LYFSHQPIKKGARILLDAQSKLAWLHIRIYNVRVLLTVNYFEMNTLIVLYNLNLLQAIYFCRRPAIPQAIPHCWHYEIESKLVFVRKLCSVPLVIFSKIKKTSNNW